MLVNPKTASEHLRCNIQVQNIHLGPNLPGFLTPVLCGGNRHVERDTRNFPSGKRNSQD